MKPRVLILCAGNSARSQMAEGIVRAVAGDAVEVMSAGLEPKGLNPYAVRVMREIGIDIAHHASKDVREFLGQSFTYLITVCDDAKERCPIFPGVIYRLHWPFEDPAAFEGSEAETLAKFREVRDRIREKVEGWWATHPMARS